MVASSTFTGLGAGDYAIGLAGSKSEFDGKARQVDIDISTPAGQQAYQAFVGSGRLPGTGAGVANQLDSEVYTAAETDGLELHLGPLKVASTMDDSSIKAIRTLQPDGTTSVSTYDQDNDVSMVGEATEHPDGSYSDLHWKMRLQGLDGTRSELLRREAGLGATKTGSQDVTLDFNDAQLMNLHDMGLDQVIHDAHRNGVDFKSKADAQKAVDGDFLAGSQLAQQLAQLKTPVDIVNYLNQHVARGNADAFVDAMLAFKHESLAERHGLQADGHPWDYPDSAVLPTPAFSEPVC